MSVALLGRNLSTYHDPLSRAYPASTAPVESVRHNILGPVLDQGQVGSCTGNAMAALLNWDQAQMRISRVLEEPDALWLYSWATRHDPYPGHYPPTDTGSGGLYVAKAARSIGLISAYSHAFGVDHLLGALMLQPCIVGTPWHEGMFSPDRGGFLNPTGPIAGGHEWLVYGYDQPGGYFLMRNSWGPQWGLNGCAKVTRQTMAGLLAQHGDVTFVHV